MVHLLGKDMQKKRMQGSFRDPCSFLPHISHVAGYQANNDDVRPHASFLDHGIGNTTSTSTYAIPSYVLSSLIYNTRILDNPSSILSPLLRINRPRPYADNSFIA